MTNYGAWLKPTLLGPALTMWVLTTIGTILIGMEAFSGGRLDTWAQGMLLSSFFAAGLAVLLIASDLMLLKFKIRAIPTGSRAWVSSLLSPLATFFLWRFIPIPESILVFVLFLFGSMTLASAGLRVMFGQRP